MLSRIYDVLEHVSDILQKIIEFIIALLIAACAFDLAYQVLYRYVLVKFFSFSSPFTEEFARYAMIWIAYLGVAVCFKEGSMPSLNILPDALKGIWKYILYIITRVLIIVFLYIGIKYGFAQVINMLNYRSPVMYLPGVVLYSAPFAACCLLAFEVVVEIFGVISKRIQPFEHRAVVQEEV